MIPARAILALGLVGCASAAPAPVFPGCPSWARGEAPIQYPHSEYLVGLGIVSPAWDAASAEEGGKNAAFSDIAKQLRVEVAGQSSISEKTGELAQISDQSSVRTSAALQNAQVIGRCLDPTAGTFYLLAVVERRQLAVRTAADLKAANDIGQKAMAETKQLRSSGHIIDALTSARAARQSALDGERLSSLLRTLQGSSEIAPFATVSEIAGFESALRQEAKVRVTVEGDSGVAAAIEEAVTRAGACAERGGVGRAAIEVRGQVENLGSSTSHMIRDAVIGRARGTIEIVRTDSGVTVASVVKETTGGGRSDDTAWRRAAHELAGALAREVGQAIRATLGLE